MDAVKFLEEYNRMCITHNDCVGCPMKAKPLCYPNDIITTDERKELVAVVEKWSKEHPIKTNGMRFLDDNREYIRTYHRWENDCKPYIEVHIEADWWDAEYKEGEQDGNT